MFWLFHETKDGEIVATASYTSIALANYHKRPLEQVAICNARTAQKAAKLIALELKSKQLVN